jgi:hypothetical protein
MIDKEKQMKIVLDEIQKGKSRKEAAKSAGIPEYKIVNWYNEGKNGFGKENIEFYIKLKEIENNTCVNEAELINKMNQFLTLFKQGKERQDILEQMNISNEEFGQWMSFGMSSVEPFDYFYNEYLKIKSLNKSKKKSVDVKDNNEINASIIADEEFSNNLITVSVTNFETLLDCNVGDVITVNNGSIKLEIVDIDYLEPPYEENEKIPYDSKYDSNIYKKYSGFIVVNSIDGKDHIFGYYDNLKYTYFVRDFLIENDWDLTKFKCIEFDEVCLEYYIIKVIKNRVYVIDGFYTYNEAYLNYTKSLKEFVIKIYLHKYGFEKNSYLHELIGVAEDLFLEVDELTNEDSWLIDRLPEIYEPKTIEQSEEANIDLNLIKNLTLWQKKIFDEINKFDDEIFSFDELRRHLLRFKSKNFDNKVRKYLGELIDLKLIIDLGDDNYKRNW